MINRNSENFLKLKKMFEEDLEATGDCYTIFLIEDNDIVDIYLEQEQLDNPSIIMQYNNSQVLYRYNNDPSRVINRFIENPEGFINEEFLQEFPEFFE